MSSETFTVIGTSVPRVGLAEKVRGALRYSADLKLPGMLYGKILRSPHAHARVARIDVSKALAMPGVRAAITHHDAPAERIEHDLAVLDPKVRFVGDEVAAVAAETEHQAEDALRAIAVEYEVLPPVLDPEAALAPGAPSIHAAGNLVPGCPMILERGSAAEGFAQADRIFEASYRTQAHSPAGMETRAALAAWEGDRLTVWKTSRAVHAADRPRLARAFGIPPDQVRVVCPAMGGGFGNKDESRLSFLAALLARKAGHPVRIEYQRDEEFIAGRSRQASRTHLKIGVKRDGTFTAIEQRSLLDGGAYVATGIAVVRRTGQGALYLYACPNARFEGRVAYTTAPPGGSYRGLGAPLGHFALECLVDEMADALGMDPLDFRLRHHVRKEGQPGARKTPPGQLVPDEPVEGGVPFSSNALHECLEQGAARIGWRERRRPTGSATGPVRRGLGLAMCIYRGGHGVESEAEVRITRDGRGLLGIGVVDVGQGSQTVLAQIVAERLGLPADQVDLVMADTAATRFAPMTSGSTTTFAVGGIAMDAAAEAHRKLLERGAGFLELRPDQVECHKGVVRSTADPSRTITVREVMSHMADDIVAVARRKAGSPDYVVNSFSAHFCEVEVEIAAARVRLLRYVAAQDSGRIINPRLAENQVEGAVNQMLGWVFREETVLDPKTGVQLNPNFLEHKCPAIVDYPCIETIFAGEPDPVGPFGAKALGEPPVVPVAAAVANAVRNATGVAIRELPLTPDRVLAALRAAGVRA
jgi:CO/xanthine dehydrogenase Mo-binding subunit